MPLLWGKDPGGIVLGGTCFLGISCCLIVYRFDVSVLALRGILLWIVLLCLTLTDLHAWIIPDRLQVAGVLIFFGTAVCLPETGAQILRGVLNGGWLIGRYAGTFTFI